MNRKGLIPWKWEFESREMPGLGTMDPDQNSQQGDARPGDRQDLDCVKNGTSGGNPGIPSARKSRRRRAGGTGQRFMGGLSLLSMSLSLSLQYPVKLNPYLMWLWNVVSFSSSIGQRHLLLTGPQNYSSVS